MNISSPTKLEIQDAKGNMTTATLEPCYPGYGVTLGNSLRRVLLSSIEGSAITSIKVSGAQHEFSTLPNVKEDLIELIGLCGFKVLEAGYVDLHARQGLSRIYGVLSHLPGSYFKDKFKKTIYVIAEKEETVHRLKRHPRIYDPRGEWEFIEKIPCQQKIEIRFRNLGLIHDRDPRAGDVAPHLQRIPLHSQRHV